MYYIALSAIITSFLILLNYVVLTVIYRKPRFPGMKDPARYPKVSILKPFRNIDDEMENNLETFYSIDYPCFEIVFGVDTLHDKCVPMLEKIRKKYPHVPTKIVPTNLEKVMNPKIDILSCIVSECDGELYWVSDSNTRVGKDTLKRLVHEYLTRGSKIVFSPIRGTGSQTIGSVIECAYMNLFVSGNVLLGWKYLKMPIIVGKSMLIEKTTLERFGGFPRFREYLAEDFMMGEVYRENNVFISTNYTWITNFNRFATLKHFCSRISRWAKMRFQINPAAYVGELIVNPIGMALLFWGVLGSRGLNLLLVVVLAKVALEYANFFAVNDQDRKKGWIILCFPLCVLVKDLLLLFIYFIPFFNHTVNWRGRSIRIGSKSRISSLIGARDGS